VLRSELSQRPILGDGHEVRCGVTEGILNCDVKAGFLVLQILQAGSEFLAQKSGRPHRTISI
jgi:hypothetical protein